MGHVPVQAPRPAEVDHFHRAGVVDEDVRRLEIPVDHVASVRVGDRVARSEEQIDALREGEAAPRGGGGDRLRAIDELRHEVGHVPARDGGGADRMDGGDSGVGEPAEETPLPLEPGQRPRPREFGPQDLDRHAPSHARLPTLVDPAEAAHADESKDRDAVDRGADERVGDVVGTRDERAVVVSPRVRGRDGERRRPIGKPTARIMDVEQFLDGAAEDGILAAGLVEEGLPAIPVGEIEGRLEDLDLAHHDLAGRAPRAAARSQRRSYRPNQARA